MSKVATIEKIHSIRPHTNADSLLCAKILEWPVVIKKDAEYKEGDLVVFISIDTIVDKDNPFFAFMEKQKWRTWNARFRGEPSSGLVCPLKIALDKGLKLEEALEGLEVSEMLNCKHYEKPIAPEVAAMARGNFPTNLISITDEDNMLSYPRVEDEFRDLTCYITQKQDGSSVTFIRNNDETHVCSRRLSLKEGDNAFWRIEKKYSILQKLNDNKMNFAIQGELCGPKMNGNNLDLSDLELYVFNIKNLDTGEYFGYQAIKTICQGWGLQMVPVLQVFRYDRDWNIERLRQMADGLKYPNGKPGEGIVIRPLLPRFSSVLNKMLSVKIINQNYKE